MPSWCEVLSMAMHELLPNWSIVMRPPVCDTRRACWATAPTPRTRRRKLSCARTGRWRATIGGCRFERGCSRFSSIGAARRWRVGRGASERSSLTRTRSRLSFVADGGEALELRDEIERALAALSAEQREAFLLHHVEGLSYEEMVEATGAGVSALKMRVKRASERLKVLLDEGAKVDDRP